MVWINKNVDLNAWLWAGRPRVQSDLTHLIETEEKIKSIVKLVLKEFYVEP